MVCHVCGSQATSEMSSRCLALCFLPERIPQKHHALQPPPPKYSIYRLCGQGLSSPPLSLEFCMQAEAAMWKRGLRDERVWAGEEMHYPCLLSFLCLPFLCSSVPFLFLQNSLHYLYICKRYWVLYRSKTLSYLHLQPFLLDWCLYTLVRYSCDIINSPVMHTPPSMQTPQPLI